MSSSLKGSAFSLDYLRLGAVFILKDNICINRFSNDSNSTVYTINFYDYVLSKINYNYNNEQLGGYYKAKLFLEELNKDVKSVSQDEVLKVFRNFQKDFSVLLLKLAQTGIKDIFLTLPALYKVPLINELTLEKSLKEICFLDNEVLENTFDLNDVYREFFEGDVDLTYDTVNVTDFDNPIFKKAYWLRWAYNRHYNLLFSYSRSDLNENKF
jgi:hypothetical protein